MAVRHDRDECRFLGARYRSIARHGLGFSLGVDWTGVADSAFNAWHRGEHYTGPKRAAHQRPPAYTDRMKAAFRQCARERRAKLIPAVLWWAMRMPETPADRRVAE